MTEILRELNDQALARFALQWAGTARGELAEAEMLRRDGV